jgi:uncharacterized membrane protein YphA (DoxX/SURF4 family)
MDTILRHAVEILILIFLIITFLQSGIDKLTDWHGNLSWLKGHFKDTPMKGMVPLLLGTVLVAEVIAAILCIIGSYQLATTGEGTVALYGAILSCVALLMLLFGQRIAKDYAGAMTIAVYFIPAMFLVFLLQG